MGDPSREDFVRNWAWPGWKAGAALVAATLLVLAIGGVALALSGLYSVAASTGHFLVTSLFLEIGMHRSVATHSLTVPEPPSLDDPNLIRLGAGAYQGGCAVCHGAPGQPRNPIALGMLPAPPDLRERVPEWSTKELFWIVKNGIKYTGMPAWTTQHREDEVWSVVAFLLKLPALDVAAYTLLAEGEAAPRNEKPVEEIVRSGTGAIALAVCARCHGTASTAPGSQLTPKLAGLPAAYLRQELKAYADGKRHSGIMQPVAAELSEAQIAELADYYSRLAPTTASATPAGDGTRITRGAAIAAEGVPANGVPACLSCHAGTGLPEYPTLAGQHAPYMGQQLRLWKNGLRAETPAGRIMAPIASRLTTEQIDDVSAYFASLASAAAAPTQ
jgi:cytochrome c553